MIDNTNYILYNTVEMMYEWTLGNSTHRMVVKPLRQRVASSPHYVCRS